MNGEISRRGWIVLMGVPALFFCVYIFAASPTLLNLPLCTVKMFVGIDCPGCGLTRSIAFLTHGQIRKSIDSNPMGVIVAIWLAYMFLRSVVARLFGKPLQPILSQKARDILLIAFVIALIGQWLFKLNV